MKILQFTSLKCGGAETVLVNYYKNLDRNAVQFDYLIVSNQNDFYCDEVTNLGATIYRIDPNRKYANGLSIFKKLRKSNIYSAIEIHTENAHSVIWVFLAFLAGFKKVVVHSHSTNNQKKIQHGICRPFLNLFPIIRFSCGKLATRFMFGKRKALVVNNAIDLDAFAFNPTLRAKIRTDLNISEKFVIGHVGRFIELKNHTLMFQICDQLKKRNIDVSLLLLGDGELFQAKKKEAKEMGIENDVLFLGNVRNVKDYLNAMDLFILPSYYEGFPTVAVEAQASGLKCILSDSITRDINLTDSVEFLSISAGADVWAEKIVSLMSSERLNTYERLSDKGFNIKKEARKMEKIYLTIGDNNVKRIKNIYSPDLDV